MFKKSLIATGALVGALLTAPLIAIFFLVTQVAGTPFPPFDVFDWVGRTLPGPLVTFGIDSIVSIITTLRLGTISTAAKTAEQTLAVLGMFGTGIVAAAVFFALMSRNNRKAGQPAGAILGLVIGVPVTLIFFTINASATANPLISGIWILVAFALWGVAVSWAYDRLAAAKPAAAAETAPSLTGVDRRTFLVRVGGASALLTIAGAGLASLVNIGKPDDTFQVDATGEAVEPWSATHALPNADAVVAAAPGTRPELTPLASHYRIDIRATPVEINEADWRLSIGGLVDTPTELTLADIRDNYDQVNQFVTLACISNPLAGDLTGTTLWTGARLKDILATAGIKPEATHIKIT
ncbi:MAG: molybdopterin-dependent oxidoreductase, partial [Anaerolineae bacterium]|nr:molybdopterin-dependent oxidoreductase [Anaerolineae bacterium]